ncbi:acyl-CoA thioesterase [Parahaliea mediterranea]|uniref:acyl-CoA thioesterase n=1 Tax=Parahaliea mediterranea TaxID=651086 RepID=UPI000E2FCA41|nr:thioesterase family protein [Parahaliea mediterranea]
MTHPFERAIALEPSSDDTFTGQIPADYANFIGPFGGVLAAVMLNAPCQSAQRLGDPLSLTVNFGGPVSEAPFTVATRPTCTNRSSQHWLMELHQNGETPVTASAVFARRRDTWADQERRPPQVAPAAEAEPLATDHLPRWVSNYEMRVVHGGMGFLAAAPQASDSSETVLWIRDNPPRPLDFPGLAAIADNFFPRVFVRRPQFVPVGTVSLTTYFHADQTELARQGDGFLLGRAWGNRYHKGYHDQSAELWSDAGQLLASTHQVVYFRE